MHASTSPVPCALWMGSRNQCSVSTSLTTEVNVSQPWTGTPPLWSSPFSWSGVWHYAHRVPLPFPPHEPQGGRPALPHQEPRESGRAPPDLLPPQSRCLEQRPYAGLSQDLTSPGSQSMGLETAGAPWESCRCRAGGAAPGIACRAAAAGSTGPSWPAPETWWDGHTCCSELAPRTLQTPSCQPFSRTQLQPLLPFGEG